MKRGFTLIELLTAMAVLALILVMMLQVTNGILGSTRAQNQQMDSVAAARRVLDVMQTDMHKAVINDSATILVSQTVSELALLTQRRGTNATDHRFLAVRYATNASNQMVRSYASAGFGPVNLLQAPVTLTAGAASPVLSEGILAFRIRVLTPSTNFLSTTTPTASWATNSYNGAATPNGWNAIITQSPTFAASYTNRCRALSLWVAAADPQTLNLLRSANKLATAQSALSGEPDPGNWRSAIDSADLPSQAKSAIRILNKTVPLP